MSVLRRASMGLAWGQAGRIIEVGLGFAFSILVVRRLGDKGYGTYALLFSLVGLTTLLSSLGLNEAMSKYLPIAAAQGNKKQATHLFQTVLIYRLLFTFVASAVLYLASGLLATIFENPAISEYAFLVVAVFALQNTADLLAAFYISTLKVKTYYLVRLIIQSLSLILTLIFFSLWGASVRLVFTALLLSTLIGALLYLVGARADLKPAVTRDTLRPVYRFALTIWLVNLLTFGLASQIDTLFIGYFLKDEAQIAHYNVAVLVLSKLYLVLTGWNVVILPSLSETFAKRGKDGLANACDLYFKLHLTVLLPVMVFVGLRARGLTTLVFGSNYEPSAPLLTVYALLSIGAVYVFGGPALNVLYVGGGEKIVLWLRVLSGGLNVLLDILLIPLFGAMGAVLATGTSVMVASLCELIAAHRLASIRYPIEFTLKLTLATGLAILAIMWLTTSSWSTLVASSVLYVLVFGIVLYVLKPLTAKDKELASYTNKYIGLVARYF